MGTDPVQNLRVRAKIAIMKNEKEKKEELLSRNVENIVDREHLNERITAGEKLRVKLGIDPTSPDLHLGHAVVLRKLREFQDLGHKAVLIIGDFTARIGDPTGRSETRKPLTEKQIKANMKAYLAQAGKIIDVKKAEIHHNSDWFMKNGVNGLFKLTAAGTVNQMLEREDFRKRIKEGGDVTVTELLYPLLQGYDSVAVRADVELGGHDQFLNLLAGRKVQRYFGMAEQDVLTVPLLVGLDGERKMSKSYGNYIGLDDAPNDMFGKVMSVSDSLMHQYFLMCTDWKADELEGFESEIGPRDRKMRLAFEIVEIYHGEKKARAAQENFEKLFSKKEIPDDIPPLKIKAGSAAPVDIVIASGVARSKSDARRLVEQGGFDYNGQTIKSPFEEISLRDGAVVKIGKKRFFRVEV